MTRAAPPSRGQTWKAILAYGALFRPWLENRPSSSLPGDVAALKALTQRYGTTTSLAWILQRGEPTGAIGSYASLGLLYGRRKSERQIDGMALLVRAMNAGGVKPLLLKGAAAHVGGLYPNPGFRLMADIDLLVPPHLFDAAVAAAEKAGFATVPKPPGAEAGHARQQFSEKFGLLLELHHRVARLYERDNFPAEMLFAAAHPAEFRGGQVLLPDWAHHAALTILHAVAWDRSRHMALVPIKALLDLAAQKASPAPVSWPAVADLLDRAGERTSLVHVETLFQALFGQKLTGTRISAARRRRILAYYKLGAAYPVLNRLGLVVTEIRRRLVRAKRHPGRFAQLANPAFYLRLASASRSALDPKTPLN